MPVPMSGKVTIQDGHECDDMGGAAGMQVMGASMGAMANHMCVTPLRPMQPGDEAKAKAVVDAVRIAIDKYKDYKVALADGYQIANPNVVEPQYHFTKGENVHLQDLKFDPTRPSSLLYFRDKKLKYRLEGVMFTDSTSATEDELNSRIPLSIARWHEHTNFCAAPADKVNEYQGDHPKFGMFGSVHTESDCKKAGGVQFIPIVFSWMIHVFPYEKDLKSQFSMNDDVSHTY